MMNDKNVVTKQKTPEKPFEGDFPAYGHGVIWFYQGSFSQVSN